MKKETNIPKGNPFRLPKNYFENLPDQVMNRIMEEEEQAHTGKSTSGIAKLWKPVAMLAAAMLLLTIISYTSLRWLVGDAKQGGELAEMYTDGEEWMYSLSLSELEEELQRNTEDEAAEKPSGEELIDYLLLQDISAGEIEEYLNTQ